MNKVEQDAKRYRYLKKQAHRQDLSWSNHKYKHWIVVFGDYATLDRSIDEAMKK